MTTSNTITNICVFKDTIKTGHQMKIEIFNKYAENVSNLFDIPIEELFSKNKRQNYADARQLLCYVCYNRPMRIKFIQDCFAKNGYTIGHANVIYNIRVATEKISQDPDYASVIKRITKT